MADPWSPPPTAQQFQRAEQPGVGQILARLAEVERQTSEMRSSLLKASGISVTPDGLVVSSSMASWDYDGTSPTNLGTKGWYLGPDAASDSRLVLNGVDVYADLSAKAAALAARVSRSVYVPTFNTGNIPNTATFYEYGPDIPITIAVPTGRLVVTVGCGEASLNSGGASVVGEATFAIAGVVDYGDVVSRAFLASADVGLSSTLAIQRSVTVTPGTYTVVGKMRAWAAGTDVASVSFGVPYLTVQVTG